MELVINAPIAGNGTMGDAVATAFSLLALPPAFQTELRDNGGAAVLFLLQQAIDASSPTPQIGAGAGGAACERYVHEAYDRAWERLHCGSWKSIHRVWRQAFGFAAVLKAKCLVEEGLYLESLRALDMCMMMAGPHAIPSVHKMINAVENANSTCSASVNGSVGESSRVYHAKKRRLDGPAAHYAVAAVPDSLPLLQFPIMRVQLPSLTAFHLDCMLTKYVTRSVVSYSRSANLTVSKSTPVIITDAMKLWPAMGEVDPTRSWQTLEYFRRVAGHRTVPIEVGSSYLEDDWGQQLMTINEFIDQFLEPRGQEDGCGDVRPVGYLAQHHLFEQIPVLGRDIMTPDYCTLERSGDGESSGDDDIAVNAWFGPKGTVSPLHFDPKDNLLCQVVGKKYLRMYAPSETDKLYPVEGLLSNTSQVDVDEPDLMRFPAFTGATYVECVLQEGEMLYIPPRYWHYVRSLSTSFSVSFWWA